MEIKARGVDVSSNNEGGTGAIDFAAIKKAGYNFAIVRVGYGTNSGGIFRGYISKSFVPQIEAAQAAGLDVSVYWYSNAATVEQAVIEAQACLSAIKPYKLDYPVYFDQEYDSPCGKWGVGKNRQLRTDLCKAFLETVEKAGYFAALYASKDWLDNWVFGEQLTAYDKWVAQYASRCTYTGDYGMWQHHGDLPGFVGKISGVRQAIDLNDCYKDYPAIIRAAGLNGFETQGSELPPGKPSSESITITREDWNALFDQILGLQGKQG